MCLIDLVEMVADWKASSERRACGLGLEPAFLRFDIAPQLQAIIRTTPPVAAAGSMTSRTPEADGAGAIGMAAGARRHRRALSLWSPRPSWPG